MVKPHSPPKPTSQRSTFMTDGEFEDFWAGILSRTHPSAGEPSLANDLTDEMREAVANRGRSNKPTHQRCGTCRGCTANDCGACKNCRDKPRCILSMRAWTRALHACLPGRTSLRGANSLSTCPACASPSPPVGRRLTLRPAVPCPCGAML